MSVTMLCLNITLGIGSDIVVPWFGKMGFNAYARYVRENFGADNEGEVGRIHGLDQLV